MDEEHVVNIYNGVLFIPKEEWNYTVSGKWMELEINMLNEISHTQKDKYCMFSLICRI
jgi:hypothetical protein